MGLEIWLDAHQHKALQGPELRAEECVFPDPENFENEIRLLFSPNDKVATQAEEKDAENAFIVDISQELSTKEAIGTTFKQ